MNSKQKWKIGLLSALAPTLVCALLISGIVFVYNQVAIMGSSDISRKTEQYKQLAEVTPKNATVFFGDSITELCSSEDVYAEYTAKTGVSVVNRGISAECTGTMLERIEDSVIALKPRNLVMLMGVNDLNQGVPQEKITENIREMIKLVKEKSPETNIILQSVYPTDPDRESAFQRFQLGGRDSKTIAELNKKLAAMAQEEKVTFLDVTSLLADENGNLKKDFTYDGLHPNVSGYLAIRDAIIEKLK